ncbi:APC family permease [Ktedonosporobacter rubrisoli]|nr:APC family permease [Ktedonosporobacter rubrisoli]
MSLESSVSTEQESTQGKPARGSLLPNAIGLGGVLFQSITTMAPATGMANSIAQAVPLTGMTLPLAALFALFICIMVAFCIGSFAKYLPSAGGIATYISRALGVKVGWVVGWFLAFGYMLIAPMKLVILASQTDSLLVKLAHFSLGWPVWMLLFAVIIFLVAYLGIKVSARIGVILGAIEIAIWIIIYAGGNNTLAVLNPTSSALPGWGGWQGVLLGMLPIIVAFGGFESCAPLAEEARNPRKIVPLAIVLSAVCIGLFFVFCSYAAVVGWGQSNIQHYDTNSWVALAGKAGDLVQLLVILAILNSALANANGGLIASTRMFYAMGRGRSLPAIFAHLNRFQAPSGAIIFCAIAMVAIASIPSLLYGPMVAFTLLVFTIGISAILTYVIVCICTPIFYLREHRAEFNVLKHVLVPLVPTIAFALVWFNLVTSLPPAPISYALYFNILLLVVGILNVLWLRFRHPEALLASGKIFLSEE